MTQRFDSVRGLRYASINLIKLTILFAATLSLCIYALMGLSVSADVDTDVADLIITAIRYVGPFAALPIIAFFVGGFAPGDRIRLIGRIFTCVYMLIFLLLLSDGMSYALKDVLLNDTTGTTANIASLTVIPETLLIILAIVPLLSAIDAFLEYKEWSTEE